MSAMLVSIAMRIRWQRIRTCSGLVERGGED
jgi:hypothetical protein